MHKLNAYLLTMFPVHTRWKKENSNKWLMYLTSNFSHFFLPFFFCHFHASPSFLCIHMMIKIYLILLSRDINFRQKLNMTHEFAFISFQLTFFWLFPLHPQFFCANFSFRGGLRIFFVWIFLVDIKIREMKSLER